MEEPKKPFRKENDLFDAKSLHELLYDHQSEDFKKSRRNLMVITFIIISVGVLGIDLTNLNILGLKLSEIPNPRIIYLVGIILIVYWLIMFEIYRKRDKDIHSLHHHIVINQIIDLKNEIPVLEGKLQEADADVAGGVMNPDAYRVRRELLQQIQDREYAVQLFKEMNDRNKPALKWVLNVEEFELKFPRALAYLSMFVLSFWLFF